MSTSTQSWRGLPIGAKAFIGLVIAAGMASLLQAAIHQSSNCLVTRRNVETGMGMSNHQLISEEGCPKRLVHWSLGGYRGECRLMILRVLVRTILRWRGAAHRIALGSHFKLLHLGSVHQAWHHDG